MGPSLSGNYFRFFVLFGSWSVFKVNITFFVEQMCFLESSTHAESSRHFLKISVLEPKRTKLNQESEHGHEDVIFADRLGPIHWAPFRSLKEFRLFRVSMDPFWRNSQNKLNISTRREGVNPLRSLRNYQTIEILQIHKSYIIKNSPGS